MTNASCYGRVEVIPREIQVCGKWWGNHEFPLKLLSSTTSMKSCFLLKVPKFIVAWHHFQNTRDSAKNFCLETDSHSFKGMIKCLQCMITVKALYHLHSSPLAYIKYNVTIIVTSLWKANEKETLVQTLFKIQVQEN